MTIVLDEYAWAQNALRTCSLGKKPAETLTRLAKYYKANGCKKSEVPTLLFQFILTCDPSTSLKRVSSLIDLAVSRAWKYPIIRIDELVISQVEMDAVDSIDGVTLRRLAFTLLCLAKYHDAVNGDSSHWVNDRDTDIMRMANVHKSIKEQSEMFAKLRELGLIRFSNKVDSLSVQILFIKDGEPAMEITDFRNVGYQYMLYHGGSFYRCENCGLVVRLKTPSNARQPKYCQDCATEIQLQQMSKWARLSYDKHRKKEK